MNRRTGQRFVMLLLLSGLLLSVGMPAWSRSPLTPKAQEIYQKYNHAVLQIRVISVASGEKSALGSGFFFTPEGLVATNYHVVADAVNLPQSFTVEYILYNGERGRLKVLNIDPVHDLAILKIDDQVPPELEQSLPLGNFDLKKGDKIFSFGNPYDMGMIIVEGLYNGLLERARYPKILFSGALNPGMSGGPAVSANGQVIGVNVSTQGNEISFLVPVEFLRALKEEIDTNNGNPISAYWKAVTRKHLILYQQELMDKILDQETWDKRRIGMVEVPGEITPEFKCWGRAGDNKLFWVANNYLSCSLEDYVYLSETMFSGMLNVDYEWYESRGFDPIRFYNIYEDYAANRSFMFHFGYEGDVGLFKCEQGFAKVDGRTCRLEMCARPYKDYVGLFDVSFQLLTTDMLDKGLVVNINALGLTAVQSNSFIRRFLKEIQWVE